MVQHDWQCAAGQRQVTTWWQLYELYASVDMCVYVCVCVFRSSCRLSFKLARADLRQPDAEKSHWQAKEKKQGNCATCNTDRHNLQYVIMHIHRLTSSCLLSLPLSSSTLCTGTKASLLQYLIFPFPFASLCFVHAVVCVCVCSISQINSEIICMQPPSRFPLLSYCKFATCCVR